MSDDETSVYLQAKLQQTQGQTPNEQQKQTQSPKAKGNKAKTQLEEQPQVSLDMQAIRQVIEDVVRAELQTLHIEQPQPFDVQALQKVLRAELHPIQTAITLLANAIQTQTEALMQQEGDDETEEEDVLLPPSVSTHDTDEEIEREFPDQQDEYEDEGEGEEHDIIDDLPRLIPPTHKLRRVEGPDMLLLGCVVHPSTGTRRWEPQHEV